MEVFCFSTIFGGGGGGGKHPKIEKSEILWDIGTFGFVDAHTILNKK